MDNLLELKEKEHSISNFSLSKDTFDKLKKIIDDGTPENTKLAYKKDIKYFNEWCKVIGFFDYNVLPIPVDVILKFIADHVEGMDNNIEKILIEKGIKRKNGLLSIKTVERRLAAISSYHKVNNVDSPCKDNRISVLISKAKRAAAKNGYKPKKKKAAIKDVIDKMLSTCENGSLIDLRDKALILFGWSSGGRRRSEISSAVFENLEKIDSSYIYHLGITKTSQEGSGGEVPIVGKAYEALKIWLEESGISEGHIFRSVNKYGDISKKGICDKTVARIIKSRIKMSGLDEKLFSGHSLRSGFLTESGLRGKNLLDAMALSRHKTVQIAAGYYQSGSVINSPVSNLADD